MKKIGHENMMIFWMGSYFLSLPGYVLFFAQFSSSLPFNGSSPWIVAACAFFLILSGSVMIYAIIHSDDFAAPEMKAAKYIFILSSPVPIIMLGIARIFLAVDSIAGMAVLGLMIVNRAFISRQVRKLKPRD